jgi:hypothetical protein
MFRRSQPLAEEIIERYVEWRENAQAVWHAYDKWTQSRGPARDVAFCVYRVAVTREEGACDRYAQTVARGHSARPVHVEAFRPRVAR